MKTKILLIACLTCSLFSFAQNPLLLKQATNGGTATVSQVVSTTTGYTFYNTVDNSNHFTSAWGIWHTDGTIEGTKKLSLSDGRYETTEATMLTAFGNKKILFAGDNEGGYGEVWVSDGTKTGTFGLQNFLFGSAPTVQAIGAIGSLGIYAAISNDGVLRLHATHATAYADTAVIYSFPATLNGTAYFKTINNILYFELNNSSTLHNEIWRTNGTAAGTYQLKDLGLDYGFASDFMAFNNNIYFITISSTYGDYVWKSDGTTTGTNKLKQISTSFNQDNLFPSYAATSTALYFTANDGTFGKELWRTDGTAAGSLMVADVNSGSGGSNPNWLTVLNDTLYFAASNGSFGNELWKFVPHATAFLVKDIFPGASGSNPSNLAVNNNSLVFSATSNANDGEELWVSDGTAANTFEIDNITKTTSVSSSPKLITSGNKNFFAANYDINKDGLASEQAVFAYIPPTKIWTGNINSDGSNIDNWFPQGVPANGDNILFPANPLNNYSNPYLFCNDFINNGSTIDVNGGLCLISGNFYNAGIINNPNQNGFYNGVFAIVSGGVTATHLAGSPGIFNGQLTLSNNTNIRLTANSYFPALRVEGGDLAYLGDYGLQTDGFSLGGLNLKVITNGTGRFLLPVGASDVLFNVATDSVSSSPVIINNSGDRDYFGVNVKNGVYSQGTSGDTIMQEAVNKTWNIFEALYGGSNATITFQWNAADELPLFDRNNVYAAHYINGAWDNGNTYAASGSNPYTVTRTGVTSFSPFSIASSATILPVNFVNVNARLVNKDAIVTWQVANESSVSYYNVQRSADAKKFTTIGSLTKLFNTAALHSYSYIDVNAAEIVNAKNIYYRLQEVDEDGKQNFI